MKEKPPGLIVSPVAPAGAEARCDFRIVTGYRGAVPERWHLNTLMLPTGPELHYNALTADVYPTWESAG